MHADAVQNLIDQLGRLPGVGPKSAQRIAYHLLKVPRQDAVALADAVVTAKDRVRFCEVCHNLSESERCTICADPRRDPTLVCVVEEPRDIVAVEKTGRLRRPLSRARRGHQSHGGHRARPAEGPRAARPDRHRLQSSR